MEPRVMWTKDMIRSESKVRRNFMKNEVLSNYGLVAMTPGEELRLHLRMERTEKQMKLYRFLSITLTITLILGGLICLS
jgi:hypothetical protein